MRDAEEQGYLVVAGDCTDEEVLKKAGIERARNVATVLSDDAANVFLTLTARSLNSRAQIIARAENPGTEKKLLRSGANRVVLPTAIGAAKIASLIARPKSEELLAHGASQESLQEDLGQIGLRIVEVVIGKTSRLAGQRIQDIESKSQGGYLIVAIHRHDGTSIRQPPPEIVLGIGDTVVALGRPARLESFAFKASPSAVTARGHHE